MTTKACRQGNSGTKRRTSMVFVLLLFVASTVCVAAVHRFHSHTPYFDTNSNGLWTGRQWFTGVNVRTGIPVPLHDVKKFSTLIKKSGIPSFSPILRTSSLNKFLKGSINLKFSFSGNPPTL